VVFLSGLSVGTEQNNPARRWFDVFIGEILPSFCLSGKGGNAPFRNLEGVQEGERVAHLEPGLFFLASAVSTCRDLGQRIVC